MDVGGSLINREKNKQPRITIKTLRVPYFYPDPEALKLVFIEMQRMGRVRVYGYG